MIGLYYQKLGHQFPVNEEQFLFGITLDPIILFARSKMSSDHILIKIAEVIISFEEIRKLKYLPAN